MPSPSTMVGPLVLKLTLNTAQTSSNDYVSLEFSTADFGIALGDKAYCHYREVKLVVATNTYYYGPL